MVTPKSQMPLFYHVGPFDRRRPIWTLSNLIRHRTLYRPVYNVGDRLSPVICGHVGGYEPRLAPPWRRRKLIAIGSVLGAARDGDVIWGTGLKVPEHARLVATAVGLDIRAVRGPLTRQALIRHGVECPEVYGDPGALIGRAFPLERSSEFRFGLVPHLHQIAAFQAQINPKREDTLLIPTSQHWRLFCKNLCRCELVLSSSLHGVIMAEAYGIPAVLIRHGDFISSSAFKFEDYFHSTGRDLAFIDSSSVFPLNEEEVLRKSDSIPPPALDLDRLESAYPYSRNLRCYPNRVQPT